MRFEDLIATAKTIGGNWHIRLTNESFNQLSDKSFRLNRKGNFVITSDDVAMEISLKEDLISKCATSFVKIERISELVKGTHAIKKDIYIAPLETKQIIIL